MEERNKGNPASWNPFARESVTKIKDPAKQREEIESRLSERFHQLEECGAVMTELSVRLALGIDDNTFIAWTKGIAERKLPDGKRETYVVEEEGTKEQKEIYKRRQECIKKWLEMSHDTCRVLVQTKSKAENGGNLWLLQAVYKDGAPDKDEEKGLTAEDLIAVARVVQAARELDKPEGTC